MTRSNNKVCAWMQATNRIVTLQGQLIIQRFNI